jgi:Uma2 family endonuclease
MSLTRKLPTVSVDEYLVGEQTAAIRHEYVNGHVYAMVGSTLAHNRIASNLAGALRVHLKGGPCQVYMSDIKVRVEAANAFYYPDLLVVCGTRDLQAVFVDDPCLIVEILSSSTEAVDRREKYAAYQKLPSLREYVLVAQDTMNVEMFRRQQDADWAVEICSAGDTLRFESVGLGVPIAEVYEGVL